VAFSIALGLFASSVLAHAQTSIEFSSGLPLTLLPSAPSNPLERDALRELDNARILRNTGMGLTIAGLSLEAITLGLVLVAPMADFGRGLDGIFCGLNFGGTLGPSSVPSQPRPPPSQDCRPPSGPRPSDRVYTAAWITALVGGALVLTGLPIWSEGSGRMKAARIRLEPQLSVNPEGSGLRLSAAVAARF
jgi:hypothetical protein